MSIPAQPKFLARRERRVGYRGRETGSETVAGLEIRTFLWMVHGDTFQNGVDWRDQKGSLPQKGWRSRHFAQPSISREWNEGGPPEES